MSRCEGDRLAPQLATGYIGAADSGSSPDRRYVLRGKARIPAAGANVFDPYRAAEQRGERHGAAENLAAALAM